jgi:glycosyltransferase involved in cell wall biosynthesis
MTTLSVAMCTYNGAIFLPAQLESIARQERLPDELVIGDDCSTDDSVAVLEAFADRAPFPVRLHVNDHNVGSTKNFGRWIRGRMWDWFSAMGSWSTTACSP